MKTYKVIFADLDGTLIETISGDTFPKGIWDIEFRFDVLDAIKKLNPDYILIVSNQGGIESGFVDADNFHVKMEYIKYALQEYIGAFTEYYYCPYNDKNHYCRKPNTGMLSILLQDIQTNWHRYKDITKDDCLMIGDASGKEGQFSDTDKKTAENFGIDYMDVEDFIKMDFKD